MDFGIIQAAAPASSPVPLTDAISTPDASGDATAFDVALAQTLAGEQVPSGKTVAPSNAPCAQQPQWLFTTLFSDNVTDAAGIVDEVVNGEAAAAASDVSGDVDVTEGEPSADSPVPLALPAPVPADTPAAVLPAQLGSGGDTGTGTPASEIVTPGASAPASRQNENAPHGDVRSGGGRAVSPEQAMAAPTSAPPTESRTTAPSTVPGTPAGDEPSLDTRDAAERPTIDQVGGGVFRVTEPATGKVAEVGRRPQAHADVVTKLAAESQAVPPSGGDATAASTAAVTMTAAAGVTAPTIAVASPPPADATAARPPVAVANELGVTVPSAAADAGLAGQSDSSGEGRPSPEFMRFAAALKQVASSADEGGRAPFAPVSPTGAAPAAAAAPGGPVAPSASAPAETPGAENIGRLVQAMRVVARPGAWEANVRLNPEHLGEVSIAVRVERNTVSAVVNADSAGVRQWLESQEQAVRSGMAEHGLQLDRFVVQRDGQRRESPEQDQQPGRRAPRGRQAAPTERFEIVV